MTVAVRRAEPDDLGEVVALVEEYCHADRHDFDERLVRTGVAPMLGDDRHGVVWIAELAGRIEGYAAVTWGWSIEIGGSEAVLDEIYTRVRNRGIGSRLITTLEDDCRARGVRRIFLETERPNEAARRLYARHGFVADTSIWMAKELT